MEEKQQEMFMDLDGCETGAYMRNPTPEGMTVGDDGGGTSRKSGDAGARPQSVKDSLKQRLSQNSGNIASSTKTDVHPVENQGSTTDPWLNPSLLEEVLAEKKLALMRSPQVVQFLQSQQAKIAMETKNQMMQENSKSNKS